MRQLLLVALLFMLRPVSAPTSNSLVLDGRRLCDGEWSLAGCGIKVRFTMQQGRDGSWKVINKRDLKSR